MLLAVNAVNDRPVPECGAWPRPPRGTPTTILVHGYRWAPDGGRDDPHLHILGAEGWPRRLGFGRGQAGLCVGFGWDAQGTIWGAQARAAAAGLALARLVRSVRPNGPVNIFAHSLGAQVALTALCHLGPQDVARMVLLAGAAFRDTADAALTGRQTEVLNVTSRENDGYDLLYEALVAPLSGRRTLGTMPSGPRMATVQIDAPDHRLALAGLGFPTRPPERRICHWSGYRRPGLFRLYRHFLHRPDDLPLSRLHVALPAPSARWAGLRIPAPMLRA
ncbi:hypothetical protein [Falsirhodobacter halotolerans]|uniref:hypothetical protein n=1 Tax=Falsirhodobacter halotolerans TaxID=1146892 RepID=UPI001FD3851F|nr:hypothetical protein [Falsirhodobacter halotolerans]MCJ8140254.1 hypothetical protein [Falsirhodobacter halotolerans]